MIRLAAWFRAALDGEPWAYAWLLAAGLSGWALAAWWRWLGLAI